MSSTNTLSRTLSRTLFGTLSGTLVLVATAQAQSVSQAGGPASTYAVSCETNPVAAGHDNCVLAYEHGLIKQGVKKHIVGRPSLLHPPRLSLYVSGDSSLFYANRFERLQHRADQFMLPAAALMASALVARYVCHGPFCADNSHRSLKITVGVGLSLAAIALPIHVKARHAAEKSIQLYNAILGH